MRLSVAGWNHREVAPPTQGDWRAWFQVAAAAALAIPLGLTLPRLEVPTIELATADASTSSGSQIVAPGQVPEGLTAAEWADVQSQIAAATGTAASGAIVQSAGAVETGAATSATTAPVILPTRFEVPDAAALAAPVRLPGSVIDTTVDARRASFAIDGLTTTFGASTVNGTEVSVRASLFDATAERTAGPITEWFRPAGSGVEQGWTITEPIGDLVDIEVPVTGATPVAIDATTARLDRPDGSILWYRGLHAFDAEGSVLESHLHVEGQTIRVHVDASGAAYPITIDPIISEDLEVQGIVDNGRFGDAVDLDGDRLVVGAPSVNRGPAGTGVVYVFDRPAPGSPWGAPATIEPPATPAVDDFGAAVAVLGDRIAIGTSPIDDATSRPGTVYIYEFAGDWALVDDVPGGNEGDLFGASLAWLSNTELAVGAPGSGAALPGDADEGAVYLVTEAAPDWVANEVSTGGAPPDTDAQLGYSVAAGSTATGRFVVAGAPGSDANGPDSGELWIWEDIGAGIASATPSRDASVFVAGDRAGTAVAFDVDRIAVGGLADQSNGAPRTAHVFDIDDPATPSIWAPTWSLRDTLAANLGIPRNDHIDLRGGNLAIRQAGDGGQVDVFRDDGTGFGTAPADEFRHSERQPFDSGGSAIAFDGRTLVVSAPLHGVANRGSVFTLEMPVMANRWVGEVPAINWGSTVSWDLGVLPGPNDTAIITSGSDIPSIDGTRTIGRLIDRRGSVVVPGTSLTVAGNVDGPSLIAPGVAVDVFDDASLVISDDLIVDGTLTLLPGGGAPSSLFAGSAVDISGTGTIVNDGVMSAVGAVQATISPAVSYSGTGVLDATNGSWQVDGNGFLPTGGTLRIGPDEAISIDGDFTMPASTRLEFALDLELGRLPELKITGLFGPGGDVVATFDDAFVTPDTPYPIITCDDCRGLGTFSAHDTGVLDVVQTPNAIVLQQVSSQERSATGGQRFFATSVDADGDWAVVGEPDTGDSGRAYVYERDTVSGDWNLRQTLQLGDDPALAGLSGDGFGTDVAIDGDTIVVASPDSGNVALVYQRPDAASPFALLDTLTADPEFGVDVLDGFVGVLTDTSNALVFDVRGAPVLDASIGLGGIGENSSFALAGDFPGGAGFVLIGKPPTTGPGAGAVEIWAEAGGTFPGPPIELFDPATTPNGFFGNDVVMVGDTLFVADRIGDEQAPDGGQVWAYEFVGPGFGPPQLITATGGDTADQFGSALSFDGEVLAVGAVAAGKPDYPQRDGAIYGFRRIGSTWTQLSSDRALDGWDGDSYGFDVAIAGDEVLVGAPGDTNANGIGAGALYVEAAPGAPGPAVVATDGEWLAVGVPTDQVVHIARYEGGTWVDTQTITDVDVTDVALSTPYLAIGEAGNDRVIVYGQSADLLFRQFAPGIVLGAVGSEFGSRVDLSGSRLAVGAPGDDTLGVDAGRVELYDVTAIGAPIAVVDGGAVGDDLGAGDRFGAALSLTPTDLWVGAPGDDGLVPAIADIGAVRRYDAGGTYANVTLRLSAAPGAGFGTSIDATPGRAAIGTSVSTDVIVYDVGTADSTLPGASTGFGNALAFSGDQIAIYDAGFATIEVWSDDGQDGTYEYTGLDATPGDTVDDRHIDMDGGVLVRGIVAAGTTGWADAAIVDDIVDPDPVKIMPEVGSTGDQFGADVAVDGDTMAVTARLYDGPTGRNVGATYVFERVGGAWQQSQRIEGASGAVAVSGDSMAIARQSTVAVYQRTGAGLPFLQTGSRALTSTPRDLDIDGELLVIGLPNDLGSDGTVGVVVGTADEWPTAPLQTLQPTTERAGITDRFGTSVSVSGNRIIVGAPLSASFVAPPGLAGYVELFERPTGTAPFASIGQVDGIEGNDFFGWSVAIEGSRFAVGAPRVGLGSVLVYDVGATGFDALLNDGSNNSFGYALDIADNVLAVGDFSGFTTTYDMTVAVPPIIQQLAAPGFEPGDNTAGSTAIATSAGTVVAGARLEDEQGTDAGAAYAFQVPTPEPPPANKILAPTPVTGEQFGSAVAVARDVMVVGAADFFTGGNEGAAYVFVRDDADSWNFETELTAATPAPGGAFGANVALVYEPRSGSYVAAISSQRDGNGRVWVFQRSGTDWIDLGSVEGDTGDDVNVGFGTGLAVQARDGGVDLVIGSGNRFSTASGDEAVYVFRVDTTTSTVSPTSTIVGSIGSSTAPHTDFGRSVDIQGRTVVVGASADSGAAALGGAVGVYRADDADLTSWSEVAILTPCGVEPGGSGDALTPCAGADTWLLGYDVAIDGDTVVAGAIGVDDVGAAATYTVDGTGAWSFDEVIPNTLGAPTAAFGYSVDIAGDVITVGDLEAVQVPPNPDDPAGRVEVYRDVAGTWTLERTIVGADTADADNFGIDVTVAVDGTIAVGSLYADAPGQPDAGAVYVFDTDVNIDGKVISPTPTTGEDFGVSVSVDGGIMVVGAIEGTLGNAGTAYAFRRDALGDWVFEDELVPAVSVPNSGFGVRVEVIEIPGANRYIAAVDTPSDGDGRVSLFERTAGVWSRFGSVTGDPGDGSFGVDIDLDLFAGAVTLAAGAPSNDPDDPGPGAVYVFRIDPEALTVERTAKIIGSTAVSGLPNASFGLAIGLDGRRLAIGALGADGGAAFGGATTVHEADDATLTSWTETAVLTSCGVEPGGSGAADASCPDADGYLAGYDVHVEGDTIVVGAIGADGNSGAVLVYDLTRGSWSLTQEIANQVPRADAYFGNELDFVGDLLAVNSLESGSVPPQPSDGAGNVQLFRNVGGTWQFEETVTAPDEQDQDSFGVGVDLAPDGTLAIGARYAIAAGQADAGAVYTSTRVVNIAGLVEAPDADAGDFFGQAVAINEDVMVVGARLGDGAAADSGSAYVFRRSSDTDDWVFETELFAADGVTGDWFGQSVALAGSTLDTDADAGSMLLAVGAPLADGSEPDDGAVYMFRYDVIADDWVETEKIPGDAAGSLFGYSVAMEQRSIAFRNTGVDLVVGTPSVFGGVSSVSLFRYTMTSNGGLSDTLTELDVVSESTAGDQLGFSVAIDGSTVVAGARSAAVGAAVGAGQLQVFDVSGGSLVETDVLTQPAGDVDDNDLFGSAVAIDHGVIVAGSLFDSTVDTSFGAAYVYERTDSGWSDALPLPPGSLISVAANFGTAVTVQNGVVAVSAFSGDDDLGSVTVYDRSVGAWAEREALAWPRADAPGGGIDGMGSSLALSEAGELAIGFAEEDERGANAGATWVVPVDMNEPANKLLAPDDGDDGFFGAALDADGDWLIVGEPEVSGGVIAGPGRVHMFRRVGDDWVYETELVDPDGSSPNGDRYGIAVAVGGDWAAVTDRQDAVQTFRFDGDTWVSDGSIPISDPQDGFSLSIDGVDERLIIGRAEAAIVGSAAIYDLVIGGSHVANTVVTPADLVPADRFGARVAIAGDRALVSADRDLGPAGESNTGSVRVLERSGTTWTQVEVLTDPVGATGGFFGGSLDIDGRRAIVGGASGAGATIFVFGPVSTTSQRLSAPVGANRFGIDVGIDGDVAVVGARRGTADGRVAGSAYTYELTSTWQLVATLIADDPEFADTFGGVVDAVGTTALVAAPYDDNDAGVFAGAVWAFPVEPPPVLELGFDIAPGQNRQVPVAPAGVAVAEFDAATVERNSDTSIAAAPLSSIELEDTPLSSIPLSSTPLSSIATEPGSLLGAISLIQVDIEGGWQPILAGTVLEAVPLQQLTLADAFANQAVGATLAATPLSSIDVNGTPLSSIPLSAIALGTVPLSSIPLGSIDGFTGDPVTDWCGIIGPFLPSGTTCDAALLADFTLIEATLAGTPLSSIPLSSIPLSSIDVADTPLSSIPLSSIDFAATPLSSIPLSSIPLSAIDLNPSDLVDTPLSSIPLSSIPLSSIPLSSIPLSSIPLSSISSTATLENTPLSSIDVNGVPLSSIPLSSIPLSSIPLSSIPLSSIPLSSIPLSSIALGPLPLSSIPLSSIDGSPDDSTAWCNLLADLDIGIDCDHGIDPDTTTLTELTVRGVPLSSIPLSSIPLSSIDLTGTPLSSIPLGTTPLSSIPLSSIPLSSIPLSSIVITTVDANNQTVSTPLSSIPLSSIDVAGSPLSSIPLSSIDVADTPLSSIPLSSVPLSSIPLSSVPLSSIMVGTTPLSSIPLSSIDVIGSPLGSIPLSSIPLSSIDCTRVDCAQDSLADAVRARAVVGGTTLGTIQDALAGLRLGDLSDDFVSITAEDLRLAVDASGLELIDLAPFDDLTLGEIAVALTGLNILLGALGPALSGVSFADLVGALDGSAITEADLRAAIDALQLSYEDLDAVGDSTLGDLLAFNDTITLADVYPVLSLISVEAMLDALLISNYSVDPNLTLGTLDAYELGSLLLLALFGNDTAFDAATVGQLISELDAEGSLEGFTLADLLLALVLTGDLTFGGFDFTDVDVAQLPESTLAPVSLATDFRLTAPSARTVEVAVELPASATYLPGTATLRSEFPDVTIDFEPDIGDNVLTWTLDSTTPGNGFRIEFDVRPTVQLGNTGLTARARVHGTDVQATAVTAIRVVEGLEPNDFTVIGETTPAEADTIYLTYLSSPDDIDVFELPLNENDILAVELSNLSQDFDLALWYRPDAGTTSTGDPLTAVSDEAPLFPITDPDQTGADAEPLEDFPRLDDVDPSLQLIGVSNTAGIDDELIVTDRLPSGSYLIEVFGQNGATSPDPAALQIQVDEAELRPDCVATTLPSAPFSTRSAITTASTNTVFVVNEQRLEQLHGAAGRADVMTKLDELVGFLQTNPGFGVDPAIIPVDSFATVRDAYADWDSEVGSCDPDAANAVVAAINAAAIDPIREQLTHVVLVGGDDVVPMARLEDATIVANEYDYRHEFNGDLPGPNGTIDGVNAFTSSSWERRYLSDEPYGESSARSLGNRFLYVSDLALGRLVESPAEIVQALDHFITYEGSLDAQSATVLGYDFLVDGSERIADELVAGGLTVDDELADGELPDSSSTTGTRPWGRADAEAALAAAGTNELISLNAHFDHYRALPAEGDQDPTFDDNLVATQVEVLLGDDAFTQSLLFSMGCHSGLQVPNGSVALTNQDWAEVVSRLGGIYIANTGFGYGDTEAVAYTEQLMALFSRYAVDPVSGAGVAPTTVGQALMFAKNDYIARLGTMSVYDEKALMESTFYGLPFYRVGLAPSPLPAPPDNDPVPDADGTPAVATTIDSDHVRRDTDRGDYYANPGDNGDQTLVAPGRPIQPTLGTDVSAVDDADPTTLTDVAHGAMVIGMTSTYVQLADPVVATPVFDAADQQPEPELGDVNFPARPFSINTVTTPAGVRQILITATGQYRSKQQVQRLDDDIDVVVFYADPSVTDFRRPQIREVNAVLTDGVLTVTLRARDDAGVDRVHLLVAPNPGVGETVDWVGIDLQPVGDLWAGSIDLGAGVERTEFIVQAKDVNGNVGVSTNKATNFTEDDEPAPEPVITPNLEVTVDDTNLDAAAGWYTGEVEIAVRSTSPVLYRVDGGAPIELDADGAFTISDDGIHSWSVTNEEGATRSGIVRIDTTAAPLIDIGTPAPGGVYEQDTTTVDVRCTDPSLVACDIVVDGSPTVNGDPLPSTPGIYAVDVTATDALGNESSTSGTFRVVARPEITNVEGPAEPVALGGAVAIEATFVDDDALDPAASYSAEIEWGDGTVDACDSSSSCSVTAPSSTEDGSIIGSHVYATSGIYSVTVTLTDEASLTTAATFEFIVVYDGENGQVNGSGRFVSGSEAFPGGPLGDLEARFAFNAQYEDGDAVPSGHTHLKLGKKDLDFKSTAYDFLILTDTLAIAEGTGQVDKQSGYRFRVDAVDLGSTDYFRIRIWNDATGDVVYDNGSLVSIGDEVVAGGGIKIQT